MKGDAKRQDQLKAALEKVAAAPEEVRRLLTSSFTQDDLLPLSLEAEELAAAYMAQKVVPAKYEDDALHVAIAVVGGIQVIVSWNFKHLVNFQREAGFNGVNLLQGYPSVRILGPLELIYDDEEKTFDAVAESRKWREETGALLATMTRAERIEFVNQRISDFPKTRTKAQPREAVASS